MDKNAIKKYAVWARRELISRVSQKALQYGITETEIVDANADSVNGKLLTAEEKSQRSALIKQVRENGYEQVMEEVAYTWFNRFCALRFMEVNGYLPSHIRVFSDDENNFKPQILTEAINLDLAGLNLEKVYKLKSENKNEELYKYLLIVQCNALNAILPAMFQKISDYTELLFPDNLLRDGSVVEQLVSQIPADNFDVQSESGQIEIIGWLYQYYISEKHEEVVNPLHGKSIKKEEVPAATQLFTTDWVVRYLIDNSVGRYWIERNPDSKLKDDLQYFVAPKSGEVKHINEKIEPKDLTVFDPCIGSGHFLIYAFDVLVKIYTEYGYSARDAAQIIVENNLYGLDIDERATQLAYFSVMMKARQYDRRFFERGVQPQIFAIQESNNLSRETFNYITGGNDKLRNELQKVIDVFRDAKEYGSILQMPSIDFEVLYNRFDEIFDDVSLFQREALEKYLPLVKQADLLARKYSVVSTNPPYFNKYDAKLKNFVEANYKEYGGDLFSIFIYHNFSFCIKDGYVAFMTPFVWMFIKTYEKLREYIINNKSIATLVQMEYSAYDEATVPICTFVLKNGKETSKGLYFRLSEFKGGMDVQKQKVLEALQSNNCHYFYEATESNYSKIPSSPIAYWVSEQLIYAFDRGIKLGNIADSKQGIATADNNKYLRLWYETEIEKICFSAQSHDEAFQSKKKWFPYNKGGEFRKWYGNNDFVVNWEYDGYSLKHDKKAVLRNPNYYFKPCFSWSLVSSSVAAFRYKPNGHLFDVAGMSCFSDKNLLYLLALCNTNVVMKILQFIAPTINYQCGDIANIPVIIDDEKKIRIEKLTDENISISKSDWDSFETSWDFKKHPLLQHSISKVVLDERKLGQQHWLIKNDFKMWEALCEQRFTQLKSNEEELNRIFIEIYGLQDELTPEVEVKDVTVRKADLQREIKSLISYAVGCMFGRYSLDVEGLILAGQSFDSRFVQDPHGYTDGVPTTLAGWYIRTEDNSTDIKVCTFAPDVDNIIPICDDEYFEDDIVGRFVKFVEVVYGKETLEENLRFIAGALGGKGLPRDVIRDYFLNGFYADHLKVYQKRPIYWLFDSGKKNGFKALVYMHRYQPDTLARMRTDYVHEQQARYRTVIEDCNQRLLSANGSERVKLSKKLQTLTAQADEIVKFEEKVHHLADMMISIDLDDGVKHNYEIFKDVLAPIK
ncbi:MAG: BREX-1 system adenine-specific DNA-methyltransferase PglX [Clostridiales bacterium]|nr:BREX-1 system adenine-specific DNA-methyltransferase PglX [Clostridiales bacterium]